MNVSPKYLLRRLIRETFVYEAAGDSGYERINADNFEHLEAGLNYDIRGVGRAEFVDWVDPQGEPTDAEDPADVELRFRDPDGTEWEAYYFEGGYCHGSGATPLVVKEEEWAH